MEQVELILQEASAHGLRNEVVTVAERIKATLNKIGLAGEFTDEQIYQVTFDAVVNPPEYFDFY